MNTTAVYHRPVADEDELKAARMSFVGAHIGISLMNGHRNS